ncbi:MAG TPA: hypothetical protein PKC18_14650, partial [Lacipirellulaceae bacterium]|nr:hypothetical protein [Lacipirellulaceae bacterium]
MSVLVNRTTEPVAIAAQIDDQLPRSIVIAPDASRPVATTGTLRVRLPDAAAGDATSIEPNSAYEIRVRAADGALHLARIPLGEPPGRQWSPGAARVKRPEAGVIRVKALVDDDEIRNRQTWEREIRQRIASASDVLFAYAGVRLEVVALDVWDSDDNERDFSASLAEFEREVSPAPADVAIGFSSQYEVFQGRVPFGGTRGAFHSHILLRERARNVLETERLELLVHELGHFLGATHSREPWSVMRPVVGDGQLRSAGARIRFDTPNALLLAIMGQEICRHNVRSLADVSPGARRRMEEIYGVLLGNLPDDPATDHYLRLLNAATVGPLLDDSRRVLEQIAAAARRQHELRERAPESGDGPGERPLAGDELLEHYVRQAAVAAAQARPDNGPRALGIALGFALDDTGTLAKLPLAGALAQQLEGEGQRRTRLQSLGQPTMRDRPDLTKHFFVSAALVPMLGSQGARSAGLVKEVLDAGGGSGFSFRDMAANRAGIVFAHAVLTGRVSLEELARNFTVAAYLPEVNDLREQLQAE